MITARWFALFDLFVTSTGIAQWMKSLCFFLLREIPPLACGGQCNVTQREKCQHYFCPDTHFHFSFCTNRKSKVHAKCWTNFRDEMRREQNAAVHFESFYVDWIEKVSEKADHQWQRQILRNRWSHLEKQVRGHLEKTRILQIENGSVILALFKRSDHWSSDQTPAGFLEFCRYHLYLS